MKEFYTERQSFNMQASTAATEKKILLMKYI